MYNSDVDSIYITGRTFEKVDDTVNSNYGLPATSIVYKMNKLDTIWAGGISANIDGEYRLVVKKEFSLVSYVGIGANRLTIQNLSLKKGDSLVINMTLGQANLKENESIYDYNNGDITLLK